MGVPDVATLNVVQLGFGFFVNFFAFNSQGFIEEAVIDSASNNGNIDKHAGYYSLSIIYAVFTIGNFVAAPIVDILSPKWAMFFGALCYSVFQVGFLFLNEVYLYVSSAILGFGAAIIWTGQGSYLSQNCTKQTTSRNSALLWGMSESSLLAGGIFLFIVFSVTDSRDHIATSTITILYSVFFVLSIISALIFLLLRTPVYPENKDKKNYGKLLQSTFNLMFTKKMFVLAFVFAYTGIEQSFWTGIYPTCISFTRQLGSNTNALLAINSICAGFGQAAAGCLFGLLGDKMRKIGRDTIILIGAIIHLVAFALIYINFPADASLKKTDDMGGLIQPNVAIALIAGGLLGFGDACWNTQIYSFLCDSYSNQSAQAFSLFKFYQSALSCAAFFYSPLIQLQWHLLILVITSLIAALGFFIVERTSNNSSNIVSSYNFSEKPSIETIQYNIDMEDADKGATLKSRKITNPDDIKF